MRIGCIGLLLLFTGVILAQGKYDANWCFGIKAGIDFSDTSSPVNFSTLCNEDYAGASISDSLGNLLFYIAPDSFSLDDYYTLYAIYNKNNEIIDNGDSINVGDDLTDAIFLPVPQSSNSYYFFYMSWHEYDTLLYGKITYDSSISNYRVILKNKFLTRLSLELGISAVKHANGNDWWLLVHESNSISPTNSFYEFLITRDSILGPYAQNIGSLHFSEDVFLDHLKFSNDGNWLASSLGSQNAADLFNFNRCNGQLSNYVTLSDIDTTGKSEIVDCEFSSDESKLYVTEGYSDVAIKSGLYQYSLNDTDINSTKVIIYCTDSSQTDFGDLLRAPDNKIYLAVEYRGLAPYGVYNQFNQYLWVVNDPDSSGTACNFQPYGYYLGDSARVYWGLPNMPNYNLTALSIYQGTGKDTTICNTDSITIGNPPVANVTYVWQAAKGITNTTLAQQTVKPDSSTWYYVRLTDTTINYSCQSVTDSFFVQVIVCCDTALLQQVALSKDTFVCKGDTEGVILTANTVPGITFNWQAAPGISNITLAQQTVNPRQSAWYYVTFTDSSSQGICERKTDSVFVDVRVCCDSLLLSQCTLSKDTFICTDKDTPTKGAVLLIDTVPGVSYTWQPAADISVHATEQIVDPSQSTWYYVLFYSDSDSSLACNKRLDSVFVTVETCLGIEEINGATQHLNIYPNPAQNIAVVEWQPVNGQLELSISDLLGRELSRFKVDGMSGKTEMDISGLVNGLYVVRLLSPAGGGVGVGTLAIVK